MTGGHLATRANTIDISVLAKTRGCTTTSMIGLPKLVHLVLNKHLPDIREHNVHHWLKSSIISSLQVYETLMKQPDLVTRLDPVREKEGMKVRIVPPRGVVSLPAATGTLLSRHGDWNLPSGFKPQRMTNRIIIEVDEVHAPLLVIPGVKLLSAKAVLGDFGAPES